MFYKDLFDLEDEYETRNRKKYTSGFGSLFELKQEKRFYKLYSALTECHVIMINGHMYEHDLYDIKTMKPDERILKISYLDDVHFFDINSFMEAEIKNHSVLLRSTHNMPVELVPAQLRSMITDGRVS